VHRVWCDGSQHSFSQLCVTIIIVIIVIVVVVSAVSVLVLHGSWG
jgi:hypothetical protein